MTTTDPSTPQTQRGADDLPIRLLAISGSLRGASTNSAALEAAARRASAEIQVVRYRGLAELPAFNPDLESDVLPTSVDHIRREVGRCDGLLIASPENAHGLAGALKNALDWLVGSVEFPGKPVALFNASPRASLAYGQLREVLRTMSAEIVEPACVILPLAGRALDPSGIAADAGLAATLRLSLRTLSEAARTRRRSGPALTTADPAGEIMALEPLFHRHGLASATAGWDQIAADGFWEVGASGQVYDKAYVLDELARRGPVVGEAGWAIDACRCRALSADTYLFTYRLRQGERVTRRATVWQRWNGGWSALYHQGTLVTSG